MANTNQTDKINAEVISVFPNKVRISVDNLEDFQVADEKLRVGSYLQIADNDDCKLMAIIENFSIEVGVDKEGKPTRGYIIEAQPLGMIIDGKFERGGDSIAIPPKSVQPAKTEDISKIFEESIAEKDKFEFASLVANERIKVPVNGNKFFNKHIAIIGSTGSGKSHTVAKIIQKAIGGKNGEYDGLNNSHVIIFDIHSEYRSAFPDANYIDVENMILPYWLLNSDELQELFIETEANDHNQRSLFKDAVVESKKNHYKGDAIIKERIHFDSPYYFDIDDVLKLFDLKNTEMVTTTSGSKTSTKQGSQFGKLTNFISRMEVKLHDKRLEFLLGDKAKMITFEDTLKQFLGYSTTKSNVTILDLSGIPFDVLSISVSLISRILFEYGYYYKKVLESESASCNNDIPLLLVYEEAHKYVPNSDMAKYRASRDSIERIAKEGRKYGVSLLLASQRPSEISDTIFAQCSNYVAMRLTNPNDQACVKKLLPDTLGDLINKLPSLKAGEGLLIGDAVVLPSVVKIDLCDPAPSSSDIPYWDLWKDRWKDLPVDKIKSLWCK
ncbi:ATP-binding protein [Segatella hominis]|uniref:ATP-binding protein n=1 Tax=Segatella hominis TaxID=2518605 RepID=UPI003F7EBDC7